MVHLNEQQKADLTRIEGEIDAAFDKMYAEEKLICKEAFLQAKAFAREAFENPPTVNPNSVGAEPMKAEQIASQEKAANLLREEEILFSKKWASRANPYTLNAEESFPSDEQLRQIIRGWFEPATTYADTGIDTNNAKSIKDAVENGFDATLKFLKDEDFSWSKLFKYLGHISTGAKAVYAAYEFISKFGKPTEFEQLTEQLEKISSSIEKVQNSINAGFANLIEHQNLSDFRKEVEAPTQILFDDYLRCYEIFHPEPREKLKMMWKKNPPTSTLSTLYTFVTAKRNIFSTMQEANKFLYATNKEVMDILHNNASRLITVNLFYYNLLVEEAAEGKPKEDAKILAEGEMEGMVKHLRRLIERFTEIDLERVREFHKNGGARQLLKDEFEKVKPAYPGREKMFPPELLPRLAEDMKERWIEANGPSNFYLMVFRGRRSTYEDPFVQRKAIWYIGDNERVSVAEKVGFVESGGNQYTNDALCIALIQPVTPEMITEHNKMLEMKKGILNNFDQLMVFQMKYWDHPGTLFDNVLKFFQTPRLPLFALHSIDKEDKLSRSGWGSIPEAPRMVGDVCTLPGLEVLRLSQHGFNFEGWNFPNNDYPTDSSVPLHRLLQFILQ